MLSAAIIIVNWNGARYLRPCLDSLRRQTHPDFEVIVVDNGSTDDTGDAARRAGASVVSEPRRGYGFACAAGAAAASGDILAFMDGDGSFAPAELPSLLAPIRSRQADLVLGTRMAGSMTPAAMPPHQRFGNRLTARLLHLLYGLHLTDLGPYRAIRRDLLLEKSAEFGRSALYRRVLALADEAAGDPVPRQAMPAINLKSPKITRKLTTEWFATRVDERHRRCVVRVNAQGA